METNNNNLSFNRNSEFPDQKRKKFAIIIINNNQLPSATADEKHLSTLFKNYLLFEDIYVLINKSDIPLDKDIKCTVCSTGSSLIENLLKTIKSIEGEADLIITLSSHGYANGNYNYFYFNGMKIDDVLFHSTIVDSLSLNVRCLILIDTCQSGTMMNLPYNTNIPLSIDGQHDLYKHKMVACISATNDYQGDQDDISDLGFDGGLTASFIDYQILNTKDKSKSIINFFNYHLNRVKLVGVNPNLSFDDPNF
jgi:hypothetical protein